MFNRDGGLDVKKRIAAGNRGNSILSAILRWRNVTTAAALIIYISSGNFCYTYNKYNCDLFFVS